ncbi:MAG: YicC family protein [Oscillospiraceae bacterium]|nr:YicC family protein [Oscillospiraceae bacterium]
MLKSMTGYGRAQIRNDDRDVLVEIRSVNSRYLEQNVRIGRNYNYLEEELKSLVKTRTTRGKVEISVSVTFTEGKKADIRVNPEIIHGYLDAMQAYNQNHEELNPYHLTMNQLYAQGWLAMMQMPDVFRVEKTECDEDLLRQDVMTVAQQALDAFVMMRGTEGAKLAEDIRNRLDDIAGKLEIIEQKAPELTEKFRERLTARIQELLGTAGIDEQRILTEAAIFSEKTAVDEETVRLRSHLSQMKKLLDTEESVGRKLDFLVQEMNREVNTIGSKIQDVEITAIVVDLKSEIEKIREQIQNIE